LFQIISHFVQQAVYRIAVEGSRGQQTFQWESENQLFCHRHVPSFRNCVFFSLFIYCSLIALFLVSVLLQFSPLPLGLSPNNSASSIVLFNRSAEGDTSGV
jgi:hypothetical protein